MFWENTADVRIIAVLLLMLSNRSDEIVQNLHSVNNFTLNPKFSKVRTLFEKLNKQCLLQYLPEQTSIDESMVSYFGRHGCKRFMRNKPIKFGYKIWIASTPAFCKSTSHIPANIPHPTSYILNIPHPEHPTSRTSHIPNIPHPEHPTSRTSHIPNIPHPEHSTSRTFHIPNISCPKQKDYSDIIIFL